jgi:hypothetical protein
MGVHQPKLHGYERVWNSTSILTILKFDFIIFKRRLELVRLDFFYYPTIVMVTDILTKSLPYLKLGFRKENIDLTITIDMSSKKCSRLGVMFCLFSTYPNKISSYAHKKKIRYSLVGKKGYSQ